MVYGEQETHAVVGGFPHKLADAKTILLSVGKVKNVGPAVQNDQRQGHLVDFYIVVITENFRLCKQRFPFVYDVLHQGQQTVKVLFDVHVLYEVQVYVFGNVHLNHFYEICAVGGYIKVSVEAHRLGVVWRKCKVYASLAVDVYGVHDIVFVKAQS